MSQEILLNLQDEPDFAHIEVADIAPAVRQALVTARQSVQAIKQQLQPNWDNTVEALTDTTEKLGRIWGVISHLHSVVDTEQLRAIYNELMPEVVQFFTEIGQDQDLYQRFKQIRESEEFVQLTQAQQAKLNHDLRDFILGGAELSAAQQEEFALLQNEGAQLGAQFSQNVLDATDSFALYIDDASSLSGLPEDALAMFRAAAESEGKSGYKIGLKQPHYLAIMQYAQDRALREKIYYAYSTRASELGNAQWDNSGNITRRLQVAQREAELLGFAHYAELSLATKMADDVEQVLTFLRNLAQKAKPFAERDLAEVRDFAVTLGITELQPWDVAYVSEQLRQKKYAFSEQEVKKYFPADKVLQGLFSLIKQLYQVTLVEKNVSVWHPDVRYFELYRHNQRIGGIYMDLYAREGKRGGAWMNDYRGRRCIKGQHDSAIQTPIAYLVCNFTPPVKGRPTQLLHDEILTLFHEMGHGLHHLLTKIDELGVSGINGVEWDAVELPSQFMENFVWEYDVLASMSEHETNQQPLPKTLYDKMIAAKNFQRGLFMVRQMEFALFDMLIYSTPNCQWRDVLQQVRAEVAVIQPPEYNRFAHSFSHIFAGGYAAGYYSYSWAEVLSADVYAAFEEEQNLPQTGTRFLEEILSVGGSRSAMTSFQAFRGRLPQIDALLKHSGFDIQAA